MPEPLAHDNLVVAAFAPTNIKPHPPFCYRVYGARKAAQEEEKVIDS